VRSCHRLSYALGQFVTATLSLFVDYFGQMSGLPCWDSSSEFGTWLSLRFGQPKVKVREGNPAGETERQRRRSVFVDGDFLLWFEMGKWEYFENGKRMYHSGQSRGYLRRVAVRLQSQCLSAVEVLELPSTVRFYFDMGGCVVVRATDDAEPDDPLWHIYAFERCLTLRANGTLEHGPSRNKKRSKVKAKICSYALNNALQSTLAARLD
jgi:hypothetical protein